CTSASLCLPSAGQSWDENTVGTVIWNPLSTSPFNQYDKVDIYVVDDGGNDTRTIQLQTDVDLSTGMTAVKLDAPLFPVDLPINRSCHLILIKNGDDPASTQESLNSSSFFMIRTQESVNGTLVPIPVSSTVSVSSSTTALISTTLTSSTPYTTSSTTPSSSSSSSSNNSPAAAIPISSKSNTLSPLVIGLITAGSVALVIAIISIALLLRTRRRFKGDAGDFKSLYDQPNSPTDGTSKTSIFKSEEKQDMARRGSLVGPAFGSIAAIGRSSSHTARSADPMIKEASGMLAYNSAQPSSSPSSPTTPSAPFPLLERGSSTLGRVPESTGESKEPVRENTSRSALTADDAQLIAETFRKSMRRPRWEDEADSEEEQDEARRAANVLLRRELSEQGLDVHRGVQRRVTIQDHTQGSSSSPPLSQTTDSSK
ncbi:hypothetical protein BGZ46_010014, partial [Entomortierella lignicola]